MLFNPYRYFIVPCNDQISIDYISGKYPIEKKEQLVIDYFSNLKIEIKEKIIYHNKSYWIYSIDAFDDRYQLLKICKEKEIELHEPKERDIEESNVPDFPYVNVLLDTKKQIFLIEHNYLIFEYTGICANIISLFLNEKARFYSYEVTLNPMLVEDDFWASVETFEKINELSMSLNSPNLFEGWLSTNDFLKAIKKKYNNTFSNISLKNKTESLCIEDKNKELKDAIKYIANGGGRWKMIGIKDQERFTFESEKHIQKIIGDDDIQEAFKNKDKKAIQVFGKIVDIIKE
ncbi:hypothetical protein [Fusibacter ferrireducens]|uniref:Uncharacterized protein n=1 Tax=Fusibacter ferrireducens TaxID=2785058 RepID=A0ABR9ZU35_9FIRM|nr:hypothetical protein [Fusibacter ferrireducens]MBF4693972.1 hypothetical protein [Fusibacter ferrireducens]